MCITVNGPDHINCSIVFEKLILEKMTNSDGTYLGGKKKTSYEFANFTSNLTVVVTPGWNLLTQMKSKILLLKKCYNV